MTSKSSSSPSTHAVHFIGIGGIGMSALARWFLSQNWAVSGSDIADSPLAQELKKEGIAVKIGTQTGTSLPQDVELVIRTQAIEPNNPEYKEALARGIQIYTYPEMVGILTRERPTIAISGAHGKSTTTALTALALIAGGLDPTVIVGTKLREFNGSNFRSGKGIHLVLEADEYGKAFYQYSPTIAVVTNIDAEHLDTYKNLAGVKKAFLTYFSTNLQTAGTLIVNRDDKNLASMAELIEEIAQVRDLTLIWYSATKEKELVEQIKQVIKIPGTHNLSNALAAVHVGLQLDIELGVILQAIGSFEGSWRRMDYRGDMKLPHFPAPIPVYDDYAHHPTEIRATLSGLREKYPDHAIICVFQPHQAKRLESLFDDFQTSFEEADITLISSLYKVPGRDEAINEKFDSAALVKAMQKKYPNKPIFYIADLKNIHSAMKTLLTSPIECGPHATDKPMTGPAVIVMMGAGNIIEYTDLLLTAKRK